jgi:hypothetical protein
MMMLD